MTRDKKRRDALLAGADVKPKCHPNCTERAHVPACDIFASEAAEKSLKHWQSSHDKIAAIADKHASKVDDLQDRLAEAERARDALNEQFEAERRAYARLRDENAKLKAATDAAGKREADLYKEQSRLQDGWIRAEWLLGHAGLEDRTLRECVRLDKKVKDIEPKFRHAIEVNGGLIERITQLEAQLAPMSEVATLLNLPLNSPAKNVLQKLTRELRRRGLPDKLPRKPRTDSAH